MSEANGISQTWDTNEKWAFTVYDLNRDHLYRVYPSGRITGFPQGAAISNRIPTMINIERARAIEAEKQVISGFYEEEYPSYQQGTPYHELQGVCTAEEVNGLVAKIKTLQEKVHAREDLLSAKDEELYTAKQVLETARGELAAAREQVSALERAVLDLTLEKYT